MGEKFSIAGFEDGVGHMARYAGNLWELRLVPGWQPLRKWGLQSYNHKELKLTNSLW